jgi:serine protease Do
VVFRPDGYILTNNHVIDDADRVTVVLQDRREFSAQVVGRDPSTDVAVIKIDARDLTAVPIGNSDEIAVGDWVVALGYPLSLGSTATAGIVSAKGRSLGILRSEEAQFTLESFIQTDAAINPGNSGGPLVNLEGQVVGISSAIASPTGFFNGYGFAVPINLARRVAEDLIRFGESHRPRLGVGVDDVDPVDAEVYKLSSVSGAEITQITPGFPAERAGMQLGDVVVAIRGRPIASSGELMEELALAEPGQRVSLGIIRYGKRLDITVELAAFEPAARAREARQSAAPTGVARLGFAATDLSPEVATTLGISGSNGVVVTDVERGSGAERSRLGPGYLIESVNGQPVRTYQDLQRLAGGFRAGDAVSMVARSRDGVPTIHNFRVRG